MGIKINDLPEHVQAQIKKKISDEANTTVPSSNMEPITSNELATKNEIKTLDTRCSISVHSRRKRLTDPGGISSKAVIDGLTNSGVIKDDSAIFVSEIKETQEKVKGEEETIVEIWEEYYD